MKFSVWRRIFLIAFPPLQTSMNAWRLRISVAKEHAQTPLEELFADVMKVMKGPRTNASISTNVPVTQPYVKLAGSVSTQKGASNAYVIRLGLGWEIKVARVLVSQCD